MPKPLAAIVLLLFAGSLLPPSGNAAFPLPTKARDIDDTIAQIKSLPLQTADEILWLARCIYSESNRPREEKLVAWVVRNRVETKFRGETYREVVLNPQQFSAFNRPTNRREHILNLTLNSRAPGWRQALKIAYDVFTAPAAQRPFPRTTRHFYSPVSMSSQKPPAWAQHQTPLSSAALGVSPQRFQFYDGVDRQDDWQGSSQTSPLALQPSLPAPSKEPSNNKSKQPQSSTSLEELRSSTRRRLLQGRIKRPTRPTVKRPQHPRTKNQ